MLKNSLYLVEVGSVATENTLLELRLYALFAYNEKDETRKVYFKSAIILCESKILFIEVVDVVYNVTEK